MTDRLIIRCDICHADPAGRWKQPAAMIFRDPYQKDGPGYACRDHPSPKREEKIRNCEKERGWKKGELR